MPFYNPTYNRTKNIVKELTNLIRKYKSETYNGKNRKSGLFKNNQL
jgi:hypothetical protein